MSNRTAFIIGVLALQFIIFLSGANYPTTRSPELVIILILTLLSGMFGICVNELYKIHKQQQKED